MCQLSRIRCTSSRNKKPTQAEGFKARSLRPFRMWPDINEVGFVLLRAFRSSDPLAPADPRTLKPNPEPRPQKRHFFCKTCRKVWGFLGFGAWGLVGSWFSALVVYIDVYVRRCPWSSYRNPRGLLRVRCTILRGRVPSDSL